MRVKLLVGMTMLLLSSPVMAQSLVGNNVTFDHQLNNVSVNQPGLGYFPQTETVVNGNSDIASFGSGNGYTVDVNANSFVVDFFGDPATAGPRGISINPYIYLPGVSLLLTSSTFDFAALISGLTVTNTGGFGFNANRVTLGSNSIRFDLGGLSYSGASGFTASFAPVATGAVPEPATWAMMLLGFGGMGVALRRRRRTASIAEMA